MKNTVVKLGIIALIIITLSIGFLLGKIFTVPGVECSKEINPLHGISILCSIFVAIYVALILDKHKESKKIKKALIFKSIDDLSKSIDAINNLIEEKKLVLTEINLSNKKVWFKYSNLKKVLDLAGLGGDDFNVDFERQFKDLKNLMTNTPIRTDKETEPEIRISKGVLKFSKNRSTEIDSIIASLGQLVVTLQFSLAGN